MNKLRGGLFTARKPQPLKQRETDISKAIADYLDRRKVYNDRLNSGKVKILRSNGSTGWMNLCKAGTPDRFCIVDGQIIFIEVKTAGGRLSHDQIEKQDELRFHGAKVINADSLDSFVEQFEAMLNACR